MSPESTANAGLNPETWDAKLVLAFLENPAFDEFSNWIDAELTTLEAKWRHASSPNALQSDRRGQGRHATAGRR